MYGGPMYPGAYVPPPRGGACPAAPARRSPTWRPAGLARAPPPRGRAGRPGGRRTAAGGARRRRPAARRPREGGAAAGRVVSE